LGLVAELSGQTIEQVKALNPALRRSAIPQEGYLLNLPAGTGATFSARLAKVPPSKRVQFVNHTVRKGETLSKIAARYDTTSRELVRLNHLKNADRIHVGMTLVIPSEGTPVPPAPRTAGAPKPAKQAPAKTVAKTPPKSAPAASSGEGSIRYSVRRGDTLSAIASRHNVSTADLTRWNRIKSASSIQAGQVLTIHRTPWRSYSVKPGDSLGRIAQSNGCSVTDLRSWNGLKGDVIQPGQNLRIRR
ncbi:MAG: LysM peptidoglycan-binding domain-containing protein, partial [Myxococcota bacterium]